MMKKSLVIIGGSRHHIQFITAAKHKGYITFVFDRNPQSPAKFLSDYFFAISTDNFKAIIKKLVLYKNSFQFEGVLSYSSRSGALKTVSEIAKVFRFNSFSSRCHDYLFNKEIIFNKLLTKMHIPKFIIAKSRHDVNSVKNNLGFPVIIKPAFGSGSENVFKVADKKDWNEFYVKRNRVSKKKIVIQRYIQGDEYCLNGFVFKGEVKLFPITRKFTLDEQYGFTHLGFKILKKGDLSNKLISKLRSTFKRICQLLGANNYFFASDIIISEEKIYVVDFGFLLDSKIDRLFFAADLNVYDILIDIVVGKNPNYSKTLLLKDNICLKFLFANKQGRLKIQPDKKNSNRFKIVEWERQSGETVTRPSSVADALGYVIARKLDFSNQLGERHLFNII